MAEVKEKLGRIPCDGCGHPTHLKRNQHQTLTMGCDECDLTAFAKRGTQCAARWLAKLPRPAQAAQEPAKPAQAAPQAAKPAQEPAKPAKPAQAAQEPAQAPAKPAKPASFLSALGL